MTRTRAHPVTLAPYDLNADYYAARSTQGGLVLTEGTPVELSHVGYARQPGLWSKEQVQGWRMVSDRVHERGSQLWMQLMHAGRVSHPSLTNGSAPLSAYSKDAAPGRTFLADGTEVSLGTPRVATGADLEQVRDELASGAERAIQDAGMDGVQLHFANSYLLHEMLSTQTNLRTDHYGGEDRLRWPLEVIDAVIERVGADRVSIRISPGTTYGAIQETETQVDATYPRFLSEVASRHLGFVEVADWNNDPDTGERTLDRDLFDMARKQLGPNTPLVGNGGFTAESAEEAVREGRVDAVSFSSAWLTHPDFFERVCNKAPIDYNLAYQHMDLWYGPVCTTNQPNRIDDAKGYTDW
eukprot:CAMPEP_0201544348 /NCGR_PEP_ID=MMETSP0173_2-20130828/949_1 /ASSEMBLY_ACC=CAM_ASM_000268 /TAXON_ID=218659 /ORGANISM="Vexillifera sp., Strain DIVA3 564/2" /LENGTH=354 /DNA_ID=CAMNT_0047952427 /DNA_START=78 /DNA_END=1142 /DNA_ORIENTATION=-